jgi:lipopolysaccharide export LptBFGC system permease protein LptF
MQTFVERGTVSTVIGIWPVHMVMALIVGTLLYAQSAGGVPGFRGRRAVAGDS